jgi:HK97 family phage major capsid protein
VKYIEILRARLAELRASQDAALAEVESFAATLTDEARSATAEEDTHVRGLIEAAKKAEADAAEIDEQIAQLEAVAARAAARPAPAPAHVGRAGGGSTPYDIDLRSAPRTKDVRRDIEARALRALEQADLDDRNKTHIDGMLRDKRINRGGALARHLLATGSDAYREAFLELTFRSNPILRPEHLDAIEQVRGLQITADASGGYLMPFTLDPTVILTNNGVVNPIREMATVITVATDNWQGVTSAGVTASYDAEESEVSDDTPTLAQPSIAVHQGQAFVPFSVQAEDDLDALAQDVAEMFADAKDRLELNAFTLGTGTGQPFGFITEAATVASTSADTYAIADVAKLQNAVAPRHRRNGSWMANLLVIDMTRAFGTALGYAFLTDLSNGAPPNLKGQPFNENSEMDGVIDAAASNKILAYGDFKKYRIHDRIGMTVELVPFLFGANRRPTGQRGWYCRFRHGARLVDVNAVKVLDA